MPNTMTQPLTTETAHVTEAAYQARWALHAGLSSEEMLARHKDLAAREGHDWAIGWPAAVDAFHGQG